MSQLHAKKYQFSSFPRALITAVHNFSSHSFKFLLTNKQPLSSFSEIIDIDQISAGTGYVTDGIDATVEAAYAQDGVVKVVFGDVFLKATGGHIGPFRYIVLANGTGAANQLCWFYDLEESITIADGNAVSLNIQGEALKVSNDAEKY